MMSLEVSLTNRIEARLSINSKTRFWGITGPSGAGKSSLLRALSGIEKNAVLRCDWQEKVPKSNPKIGMVFQQPMLFPHVNVMGNLSLAQRHKGQNALSVIDAVKGCRCEHLLDKSVQSLSGGEAQRVAIARALVNGPDILLLDESLSAVDVITRREIYRFLKDYCDTTGSLCIFVSHDLDDLALFSDELTYIENGNVTQHGLPSDVLNNVFCAGTIDNPSAVLTGEAWDRHNSEQHALALPANIKVIQVGTQRVYAACEAIVQQGGSTTRKTASVAVKASDVSLDTNTAVNSGEPTSSILNSLLCNIVDIAAPSHASEGKILITLTVKNSGERSQLLYASISELSLTRLKLTIGTPVLARFKLL